MSFRGRGGRGGFSSGRGGFGGGRSGRRGGFGGGGGGRGGGGRFNREDEGPPEYVKEFGYYTHPCQNQLIIKSSLEELPFFNAPIYTEDKQKIGKVDEIFGAIKDYSISVSLMENYFASSFKMNTKFYIDPSKLLPLARFLPQPPRPKGIKRPGSGGGGSRGRGSVGFGRGGGGRGGGFGGGRGRGGIGFGGGRGRSGGGFGGSVGGNVFRGGFRGSRGRGH